MNPMGNPLVKLLSDILKELKLLKNGQFRKGKSQRDVAKMAQRILRNGGTKKGQVRKTARRAYEKGRKKVRR